MHSITTAIEYRDLGHDIIGSAFDVRRNTGRGLREKFYEAALAYELTKRGHRVKRQVPIPARYDDIIIDDSYQADLIVDEKVIIELKAVSVLKEVECRQLYTYLRLSEYKLGYLINFGTDDFSIGRNDEPLPYYRGIYRFVNNL